MASKEITTFIIDLSPSMANKSNGRTVSDLEYGLNYFYDLLCSKILKGRKTDYITVIAAHSPRTDNPFAREGSFNSIEVISNKIAPKYDDLKRYKEVLKPNTKRIGEDESDCFESMLVGIGLLKDTQKLKFIRNVIVITNAESRIKSFDSPVADATERAINEMDIKVILNGIDFDFSGTKFPGKSQERIKNESEWISTFKRYRTSEIFSTVQLIESALYMPPLKKVKPIRAFRGQLRFGNDPTDISEKLDYDRAGEHAIFRFNVELYPALKVEKLPNGHQYIVHPKGRTVDKVKNVTEYFINLTIADNDNEDDEVQESRYVAADDNGRLDAVPINSNELTDGFKYSNYDLLTLDEDLLNSAKLDSEPGMDILGFIRINDLPYAYLTGESYYLLPESSRSYKNLVAFNGLCKSLIELDGVALIRYVQKTNEEIHVCALMPSKIKLKEKFTYSFIMIRLPFREDEKIGKFPLLTSITSTSGKSFTLSNDIIDEDAIQEQVESLSNESNLPTPTTNKLMESFILSKDLDKSEKIEEYSQAKNTIIENRKTSISTDLIISNSNNSDFDIPSKLMVSSPAIHKFNRNIKKILLKSLTQSGFHEYLNNPNFVQKNLISDENDAFNTSTNLFNLSNILRINSIANDNWLMNINEDSINNSKRLIKELDIRYLKQEDESKKKRKLPNNNNLNDIFMMKNAQGNYGEGEVQYETLPDVNDLLN